MCIILTPIRLMRPTTAGYGFTSGAMPTIELRTTIFHPFLFAHRKNCQMFISSDRIALDLYQQSVGFCVCRPRLSPWWLGRSAPLFLDRRHSYRARRGVSTEAHENDARQQPALNRQGRARAGSYRPSPERWPAPTLTPVVNLPPWGHGLRERYQSERGTASIMADFGVLIGNILRTSNPRHLCQSLFLAMTGD